MSRCGLGCRNDLLIGGIGSAVADVFHHRAGEQMGVLQYHGDVRAENVTLDVLDVHTVNGDGSFLNVVETVEQIGNGGLTGTGRADKGDFLTGMGVQGDVLQNDLVGIVAEGNVGEYHVALHLGHIQCFRCVCLLGFCIHYRKYAFCACKGREDSGHLLRDLVDGHGELSGVVGKYGQTAGGESGGAHEDTAHTQGNGIGNLGGVTHDGTHDTAVELGFELFVAQIAVQYGEFLYANVLVVEDLNDLLTRYGFFNVAVYRTQCSLLTAVKLTGCLGNGGTAHCENRDEDNGDDGEDPVGGDHEDESTDERYTARDQRGQGVVEHCVDVVHIVGETGHDLTGGMRVKIANGELLQLGKEIVADLFQGGLSDVQHQTGLQVAGANTHQVNAKEDRQSGEEVNQNRGELCTAQ